MTICPTHPATLNLSLLYETMIRYPALEIEDNETTRDFGTFMIAGSGFQVRMLISLIIILKNDFFKYLEIQYSERKIIRAERGIFYEYRF